MIFDELIAGQRDYEFENQNDRYRLKYNKELTIKQKLAHYKTPDYCIVTKQNTLGLLRIELDSLVLRGGIYYSLYDHISDPSDFVKTHWDKDEIVMVVLYFDDAVIDLMGEILNVECRMSKYDT